MRRKYQIHKSIKNYSKMIGNIYFLLFTSFLFLFPFQSNQNLQFSLNLGNGIVSFIFFIPVINCKNLSIPIPNPE